MTRKKSPNTLAKDRAWAQFSTFIRTRDCLRTSGNLHHGTCISCEAEVEYNKSQAGHFIAGRTNAILLDEDIVHLQCYRCNIPLSGNGVQYFIAMEKLYSRREINRLLGRRYKTKKMSIDDWNREAIYWGERTKELLVEYKHSKYGIKLQQLLELKKTLLIDNEPEVIEAI